MGGDVTAHSGDGSIRIDGVNGALNVDTGDGSIVLAGKLTSVRARTGDGSVTIHAETGQHVERRLGHLDRRRLGDARTARRL